MSVNGFKTQPATHVSLTYLRAWKRILSLNSELLTVSHGQSESTNGSLVTGFVSGTAPDLGLQTDVRWARSQLPETNKLLLVRQKEPGKAQTAEQLHLLGGKSMALWERKLWLQRQASRAESQSRIR